MASSSPEPMTWQDELASLISDTGIRYSPAGVGDSDHHPPAPLYNFEVEEDESNVNQSEKSLKEEAKEFMKATGEMLIELGKGVRDIAKQSMVGADEFYYVRIGKKKMKEVGKRLEFLNDYVLPEDKDPVYSWIVVISVAFLAISGFLGTYPPGRRRQGKKIAEHPYASMCLNSGQQASVESPKKLYQHPPSATRIQLPDGRHIAYHEQGVTGERARFSLVAPHSFLSSRLAGIPGIKSSLLEEFGVRLVTYDLPGFGESDPHPERDLNSSAVDMMHLANSVGIIDNFWVMGYSGGGKHAWAAVRYIPEKLAGVAMFAPMGNPYDSSLTNEERYRTWEKWTSRRKFMYILARRFPAFLPYFYKRSFLSGIQGRLEKWLMLSLGKKDRALVEEEQFIEFWERDVEESVRQGNAKPFVEEAVLEVSDWGFRLADLQVQKKHEGAGLLVWLKSIFTHSEKEWAGFLGPIHIWQGTDDRVVPPAMTEYVRRVVPGATVHRLIDEGHFSYFWFCDECHRKIFSTLFGVPQGPLPDKVSAEEVKMEEKTLQVDSFIKEEEEGTLTQETPNITINEE